jgi:hypothetical protein
MSIGIRRTVDLGKAFFNYAEKEIIAILLYFFSTFASKHVFKA